MKTLELVSRSLLQLLLAACAATLCVRLCTGCTLIRHVGNKTRVVECLKSAYAEGGAAAVSNRIETLVVSGDLSRKQADRLHAVARTAYERLVERMESELAKDASSANAPTSEK